MSAPRRPGSRLPNTSEIRRFPTPATPWAERDRAERTDRVNVRISPAEKAEMVEDFGLGVREYLLRLHRLTVAIQGGSRKKRHT